MAITITEGFTWASGNTVTPTRLNTAIRSIAISLATDKLLGRVTAGTGAVEEVTCTDQAQALLDDTDAETMRTTLGLLGSNLESNLANSIGVTQAGSAGADQVFNTPNAPTVDLTVGTWLVLGSLAIRTSDVSDHVWAQFYNSTDATAFGGSAGIDSHTTDGLYRRNLSVVGFIVVASGTKTIYFKGFRAGSGSLDLGNGTGPAGKIIAIRLNT